MNKGIIYAVIGTVLIGGGIGAYLYFRKKKLHLSFEDEFEQQ